MSKFTFTRRAFVASTAMPAVAVLPLSAAVADPAGSDGELLRLGAALNRIEQEWLVQHAIDAKRRAAWEAACEAAGLPRIDFGSIPDDDWRAYQDKRSSIWTDPDMHELDEDDDGEAWGKINDQLYRLVDEILPLKASTPAGLAVQAKAVVFAASDLWDIIPDDEPDDYNPHERLFIEAVCAFCGIAPLPMQRQRRQASAVQS